MKNNKLMKKFQHIFLISLLLTLSVGQTWAGENCDFLHKESDDVWIKYVTDAGTTQQNIADDGQSDIELGSLTNLSISEFRAITKKHDGNVCHVKMYYGINTTKNGTKGSNVQASYNNSGYADWTWDNWWAVQQFKNTSVGIDLIRNRKPGTYYFDFCFAINGNSGGTSGCYDDQKWWSNNGGNYHISYTIPDPTINITGFSSLVAGTAASVSASITNYPVGATLTKLQVSGNVASTVSKTGTGTSISSLSFTPNASGSNGITVTVTVTYGSAGTKTYTYNYNVTPPAVSDFTITPSGTGYLSSGSGTSGDPYLVTYNGTITFGLSGATKAYADGNASAQYSTDGTTYGTTGTYISQTHSSVTATTNQNWVYKARLKNGSLYGAVKEKTVYWKVPTYTVTLNMNGSYTSNGTSTATHGTTSLTSITAPTRTGYDVEGYYTNAACTTKVATPEGALQASTSYTDASKKWNSLSNQTLYAKWKAHTYTVTLNAGTGGSGSGTMTVDYDATTYKTWSHTISKTGYNISGWYTSASSGTKVLNADGSFAGTNVSGYITDGKWSKTANCPLYAHWTAKQTTVSFSQSGEGYASGGQSTTKTASYGSAMPTPISIPTAANGYAFMGYYDAAGGEGTQYYTSTGSSARTWNKTASTATLYAYFKKAEVTNITLNHDVFDPAPTATGVDDKDYVTATPTIAPTPVGDVSICWAMLYENDNPVPAGHDPEIVAGNTVKFSIVGLTPGSYKIRATLHTGTGTCGSGTTLGYLDKAFSIASDYTVTILYKCGDEYIAPSITKTGKATEWTSVSAPTDIFGYSFSTWETGDGITLQSAATTNSNKFKATFSGTLTAVYTKKNLILLKNTLGWSAPYVYFYKDGGYWDASKGAGGNGDQCLNKNFGIAMVRLGTTDIWYYDIHNSSSFESQVTNEVAFTDGNKSNQVNFYEAKVIYGTSYSAGFNAGTPMFVPTAGQSADNVNSSQYYSKGYWTNYIGEKTGYTLIIYNSAGNVVQKRELFTSANKLMTMTTSVDLDAATTYTLEVLRDNNIYYTSPTGDGNKFTTTSKGPKTLSRTGGSKGQIQTNAAGTYTFTLGYSSGNLQLSVAYPITVGDFRLVYTDNAEWSQGTSHTIESWKHPSRIITHRANGEDIISFFISKGDGITAKIRWEKVTSVGASSVTWGTVGSWTTTGLTDVPESGVYNFKVTQNAAGSAITSIERIGAYTGEYYIRCGALNSKWDHYTTDRDHAMTYSSFSESDENSFGEKFSHYKAKWCERGTNVIFCIANDYSPCISDTLIGDVGNKYKNIHLADSCGGIIKTGDLRAQSYDGTTHKPNSGDTEDRYSANIRFMWNRKTNKISRAYVASSTNADRKFLVLRAGSELHLDDNSVVSSTPANSVILIDKQNWMYEEVLMINPGTRFKLFACYAEGTPTESGAQYFRGAYDSNKFTNNTNSVILIGGTPGTYQKARIIYDFKTNRLIAAWIPSGADVSGTLEINADVLIEREHQEAAQCVTFANSSSELSAVKTVYGAMKFNRWILNNRGGSADEDPEHGKTDQNLTDWHPVLSVGQQKSIYERSHYYISFPFDVKVSDIFGFGRYWDHWYLEYYDGLNRAKNGYWLDSPPNWKYVTTEMADTMVLRANVGYILGLDLDFMQANDYEFWSNGISTVELFFPSTTNLETLKQTTCTIPALSSEYKCTINRPGDDGDRRVKDSYWRCIGVPSLNIYNSALKDGSGENITWKTDYTWHENESEFPFIYMWNKADNTLTPQATSSFRFLPMHAYLVQNGGQIVWTAVSAKPSSVVARRENDYQQVEYSWRLELAKDSQMVDQAYIRMSNLEQITDTFDFGQDMIKEFNKSRSNIYSFIGYEKVAANSMPLKTEQTTIVAIGLNIVAAGDYTFAMPDGTDGVGITLVDSETGTRTNLGAGMTYTLTLAKGDYNNRLFLEISPVKETPTGLEQLPTTNDQSPIKKLLIDGILYIVRDGKIFDARGVMVK